MTTKIRVDAPEVSFVIPAFFLVVLKGIGKKYFTELASIYSGRRLLFSENYFQKPNNFSRSSLPKKLYAKGGSGGRIVFSSYTERRKIVAKGWVKRNPIKTELPIKQTPM